MGWPPRWGCRELRASARETPAPAHGIFSTGSRTGSGSRCEVGNRLVESAPAFVGERRLYQSFEQYGGAIVLPHARKQGGELVELHASAFMGVAVALHQAAHARHLEGEGAIPARGFG